MGPYVGLSKSELSILGISRVVITPTELDVPADDPAPPAAPSIPTAVQPIESAGAADDGDGAENPNATSDSGTHPSMPGLIPAESSSDGEPAAPAPVTSPRAFGSAFEFNFTGSPTLVGDPDGRTGTAGGSAPAAVRGSRTYWRGTATRARPVDPRLRNAGATGPSAAFELAIQVEEDYE